MAKKLVATGFRIDTAENAIYLEENILHQRLLLITDVTVNRILYNFADEGSGLISINYDQETNETKLILRQSMSSLGVDNSDTLQVLIEEESTFIRPEDPFLDPVSKIRVSTPENLIDTDFEYGLQATKWETLKLVNNIPSFYSKNGVSDIFVSSAQATTGDNNVIVTATSHGLAVGSPFEITGLSNSQFEGGYIVTSVISSDQFSYQLPFFSTVTQELSTVYTTVLPGAFYFGSQITVVDIRTNGLPGSHLTVETRFPHGFSLETPFYFLNTVAVFRQDISVTDFVIEDTITNEKSTSLTDIGESSVDWRNASVTPYNFIGKNVAYFDESNVITDVYVPISSARVTSAGAGYKITPTAFPRDVATANVNSYQIAANGSAGINASTEVITTAANNFQTGDRVEIEHTQVVDFNVSSNFISEDVIDRPFATYWMGSENITQQGPTTRGYSPVAIGSAATFSGVAQSGLVATITVALINVTGTLQVGQEIQMKNTSGVNQLPVGVKISSVQILGSDYQIGLAYAAPAPTGVNQFTGSLYATNIDTIQNTFKVVDHGFETGDFVTYFFINQTGGTGAFPASNAGPAGLVDNTGYYAIKKDDNTFRLATTRENAYQDVCIDITDIGYGTQSAGALYGAQVVFVTPSKNVYWRRLTGTTGSLFPTRADALANTNKINIRQIANATNLRIVSGRAVLDANLTGDAVTSIDVLDGGWTYNQNSTIVIVPHSTTRALQTNNDGGGLASGSTTLRVKQESYDVPLVTGMRVTASTGIQNNTFVQSIQGPDVNGFLDVVISPVTNANLGIGANIRFTDNNAATSVAVPNIRARCIRYPGHGFSLVPQSPLFFVAPPNPPGVTPSQNPAGILESRVYFAYPIDEDHFALTATRQTAFTQAASNARQNISTKGTTRDNRKFMFCRAAEITATGTVNLITNSVQVRDNIITAPTDPDSISARVYLQEGDQVIAALDNAGNGSVASITTVSLQNASAQTASHRIYYVRNVTGQNQFQLSLTPSGPISAVGARTNNVFIVPVIGIQESDSIYIPNHGFQDNDFITYTTTGITIGGLNAQAGSNGYNISRLSDDRFKLKSVVNNAIIDLTNFGSGTHTFSNTKFNPNANVIQKLSHGFETGNVVIYDADGKPVVDGLISNNQYYIKKVSDDGFRVAPTGEDLKITAVSKAQNATTITITFEKNHGLAVGDSIIIRDNPLASGYMNTFWTVATVPATPTVAGSPSSITVTVPSYIDKYPVVTQNLVAGRTYGIAFKYVNFKYVTANNGIITPAGVGNTFTTLRAFDTEIAKETPLVSGGSIVANQRVRTSTVIPVGSLVDSVSGSTIRSAKIYFKRNTIATIERSTDVVTVTTDLDHGYVNGQTVVISEITTSSFNTGFNPVTITVTNSKSFTFSQVGADELDEDGGFVDLALTSAQAELFNANGIDSNTTAALTIQATSAATGYPNRLVIRANASNLPRVTKTLAAGAGLIGQTALTLPNLDEIVIGMPVSGTGIRTNPVALVKRIISDTAPFQIELTQPLTANTVTTANAYTFYKTQIGQEWKAATPHASETVRANTNASNEFRLTVGPVPAAANNATGVGHFVTGVRATSTFAADEDPDTNTFEVPTTDNVITLPRVLLSRYVGPDPYTGPASYLGATGPGTAGTTTTAGAGWTNIRQFETGTSPSAVVNVNADTITIVSHPYVSGDRVIYDARGGIPISPLVDGNSYYIIASDVDPSLGADGIQLASSLEDALAGTELDLTTFGDGFFHRFVSPYVLQGSSGALTGSIANATGSLAVGMTIQHVSIAATPLFLTEIPAGTQITEIVDHGVDRSYGNAFKYRLVVDTIMTGLVGSSLATALDVTNGRIRAGAYSVGTRVYTNSTTGLAVGMKVDLGTNAAGSVGTLAQNTLVTAIDPSGKYFDVNNAPTTAFNCVRIIAGAGTSDTSPTTIFTSDTTGLIVGMVFAVDSVSAAGGAGAITAISDTNSTTTTRVTQIAQDGKSFAVSRAFSTALKAAKLSAGASGASIATTGAQTRIYVYDTTNIRKGMFVKVTGGAGDINGTPNAAAGKVVNLVVNNNANDKYFTLCTANTVWTTATATEPNTTLTTASLAIGVNSATDKIHLPSVAGFNTGMTIELDAAFAGTLGGSTTVSSIDPVLRTITVSPQPSTPLEAAEITGTIADGIIEGLYVSSNEPNFPIGATVTDVTGTTITISANHGGVRSGQRVTFSPFAEGTRVTTITADNANGCRVVLSQGHAGLLGGTNVEFRKLPPNCFLSGWGGFSTTTWDHFITPRIALPASLAVDVTTTTSPQLSKPYEFIGSDKNLGSLTDFETNGTHIFTRSSNADGVYTVEDIPSDTEFVVRTDGFIPFNTKSFLDTNVDYVNNFIFIAGHKFRDGTSLIYRKGAPDAIPTLPYIDFEGNEQTTLIDGQTYYAVVVDPNFIKLAPTFDQAVAQEPETIEFDENATPMEGQQSFDTFSILGLTSGDGVVKVSVESDIVTGIGTKFLTNFKGGDILRFYTAANPGLIFNYTVASVKSDISLKLQTPIEESAVAFDPITNRTTSGTTTQAVGGAIQTMTINSSTGLAVGYIVSDLLGVNFSPDTRITAINGNILSLSKPILAASIPTSASIIIQPVFQYFINTNVYVKSNAVTVHRPFDGGVTMTTGLVPDSTITRQSRRYFRYQSGKGIQCSMAINFNPPSDVEALTSSENIAKITVDVPHGFRPGTTNRIRVTEAEVVSGHNGYNGQFDIAEVIDDYSFTYVYEDTKLIGKFTNNTSTVTNIADFTGIEVGKIVKAGTYSGITIDSETFISAVNQTAKTVTLDKVVVGNTSTISVATIDRVNNVVTVTTATDHGLVDGTWIGVEGVTETLLNISSAQIEVLDATTFTYSQTGVDASDTTGSIILLTTATTYRQNGSSIAYGFPKFNLVTWQDAVIRAGLFDTQNGMYFEYDGNNLYCVRRSSVQQLAGKATATYRSSLIVGDANSKFETQLSVGEYVVIRGMSYKVIGISSNSQMYIQPEYRGSTLNNIVLTKTVDTRVPQSQWNLDKADGKGRSGFILDINKIQMVYIDYSWYGAGKIRFGFKNNKGEVVYFHEFVHNNRFTEAYMRSGNVPARYEVVTFGNPTFSPQLFHWGTSVIMDGRFDDDKAYLFTADSSVISLTNGATAQANSSTGAQGGSFFFGQNFITIQQAEASKFTKGATLIFAGSGSPTAALSPDTTNQFLPPGTKIDSVDLSISATQARVYLTNTFRRSSSISSTNVNRFIVGQGQSSIASLSPIPLVSIRLAPSVDNGLAGGLGFRDIINRMQLTLNSCGVLVSHESEVRLFLNGELSDSDFINNQAPSLSQLYRHEPGETIKNGVQLFSFRASGGVKDTSTGRRTLVQTSAELGEIATLGNSILGGDEVFPNGPDILTITATPIDTSTINAAEPYQASARITWSESQA